MRYLTFFGLHSGVETAYLAPLAAKWAKEHEVKFQYREISPAVRAEYNVDAIPTLRFFDERSDNPRIEAKLRTGILRFLEGN